jgi:transposase
MSVPGIGPIISSAMVAAIGAGDVFTKGRDFAAWLGLVPKQISTGDRTILGKISRRGNRYLRVLFVQAAWVVLIKPKVWEPAARASEALIRAKKLPPGSLRSQAVRKAEQLRVAAEMKKLVMSKEPKGVPKATG